MNGTFRKGREYKFRQVPFNDITVEYAGANGYGSGATKFYFNYGNGVRIYLKRGKINPKFIETRVCLEQPRLKFKGVQNVG
jgi:hypothetical protein